MFIILRCNVHLQQQVAMADPVMLKDGTGYSYERSAIKGWLDTHSTSPITGKPLESNTLVPNHALRSLLGSLKSAGRERR